MAESTAPQGSKRREQRSFAGIPIVIEYRKGDIRTGKSPKGNMWSRKMKSAYGRIINTKAHDGDPLDIYLGDKPDSATIYVVDQMKYPDFKTFDEQKFMLGYDSLEKAKAAYLENYPDKRVLGRIRPISLPKFKEHVANSSREDTPKLAHRVDMTDPRLAQYIELNLVRLSEGKALEKMAARKDAPRSVFEGPDGVSAGRIFGGLAGIPLGAAAGVALSKSKPNSLLPFMGMAAGQMVGAAAGGPIAKARGSYVRKQRAAFHKSKMRKTSSAEVALLQERIKEAGSKSKGNKGPKSIFENKKVFGTVQLGTAAAGSYFPSYAVSKALTNAALNKGHQRSIAAIPAGMATGLVGGLGGALLVNNLMRNRIRHVKNKQQNTPPPNIKEAGAWGLFGKGIKALGSGASKVLGSNALRAGNVVKGGAIGIGGLGLYGGYKGIGAARDLARPNPHIRRFSRAPQLRRAF